VGTLQNEARMGGMVPEIAQMLPPDCPCLDKLSFSSACCEAFERFVSESGRSQVLLCGVESHICIGQTAHDLMASGLQVHVAADAVSSRRRTDHETALARLTHAGAVVTTAEAAIYELLYEAGTPEFREVLKLVR
jgi:isochorismate hydrolase